MKRIISFFALLLLSILLVSCKTDTKKNVVENLNITNDILTFDKIEGALSYNIYVNDSKHEAFENRYNLSLLDLSVGLYDVTVTSVVNDKESAHSEVIVYEVKAVIETEKLSDEDKNSLLKTLDKEFSLNMSKDDFLDESNYYSYVNALRVVNNYDETTSKGGLDRDEKIELFTHVFNSSNIFGDFDDILAFYDKAVELRINKTITANIIYDLLLTTYEMNLRTSYDRYDMLVSNRLYHKEYVNENLLSSSYQSFIDLLDDEILKEFFSNPYKYNNYYANSNIIYIIFENGIVEQSQIEYLLVDDVNKTSYLEIYNKAFIFSNNNERAINEYHYQIIDTFYHVDMYQIFDLQIKELEEIFNNQKDVLDDEGYQTLLNSKEELVQTFEDFYVFIEKLRPVVSKNLIEFFVNFDFNNIVVDEVYRYKNQIFNQLLIALPSEESFENLFNTIEIIMPLALNAPLGINLSELSGLTHSVVKALLEVVRDIPKDAFVSLKAEVDLMKQQGITNNEIVQYVLSSLGMHIATELFNRIVSENIISKDDIEIVYNLVIDQLVNILRENEEDEDLINSILKLKDLFNVFYELEMLYNDNLYLIINHLSVVTSVAQGILLEGLYGVSKDDYVIMMEMLINSLSELIKLGVDPINNSVGLNNLYEIILWASELIAIQTNDSAIYQIVLHEKDTVIGIIAEMFVMLELVNNNVIKEYPIDFILIDFDELKDYDFYYPFINMLSNASDYITQSTKGIVEMLFENMITTEYTNYTEEELNEMKTLMISQIDEFDTDVKVLNELDYKNLTDNDKLLIDDFFYNYFNFGGGSLNIA